ncbi:MAG TPA: urea ABC transporter permease subunit UrtC [Nitrospiria bacterium]
MIRRMGRWIRGRRGWAGTAFLLVVLLPGLNTLDAASAFHMPDYYLNLLGKYLCFAIMALGLGLLWGQAGILSLGQAVFFGLGGYCMGMYLMLEIGSGQSKYGEAMPDFMVWNQVARMPLFWKPFESLLFTAAAVIVLPMLAAVVFGYLTFRSRIRGVYVAILTQAAAYAAWLLFNRNEMNLGGTNGLTDFKTLLGFPLQDAATQRWLYILTALFLVLSLGLCRSITQSKLGGILRAIRDNESRLRFCGFSTTGYKVFVFSISAILAGIAGALYVPQVGIITPSQIGVLPSLEVVVWVALGGREHLIGGPVGAVAVNALRSVLTTRMPELWPFILGGMFVAAVLLFPAGLAGLPSQVSRLLRSRMDGRPGAPKDVPLAPDPVSALPLPRVSGFSDGNEAVRDGAAPHRTQTVVYLEGVSVSFEGFLALRDLNFYMDRGELRFVIGPNGAGKTTLLDLISGRVKPAQGRVIFEETDLRPLREHQIAGLGIGRKFQTPSIFPRHTVYEHMALAMKGDKGVRAAVFTEADVSRDKLFSILDFTGLGGDANRPAGAISHGRKQWLEIAMLMAQDPKLLLIDEPVAGMTGREREQTGMLLEAIARTHSVLVIEHDMEFVRRIARRVTVLHEGTVLCEGTMSEVQSDPRVIEVYLGREREAHA